MLSSNCFFYYPFYLHYSAVTTCPRRWTSTSTGSFVIHKSFISDLIYFKGLAEQEELATLDEQLASSTKEKMPLSQDHWLRWMTSVYSPAYSSLFLNSSTDSHCPGSHWRQAASSGLVGRSIKRRLLLDNQLPKFLLVSCYLSNPNLKPCYLDMHTSVRPILAALQSISNINALSHHVQWWIVINIR